MIKKFQKISLVFIIALISFNGLGQFKQKVADKYYDQLAFFKAVELYEDLAKKKKATDYQVRRTADCYRLIGDYKNSEKWYEKLVSMSGVKDDDRYNYALMLKSNEKYAEANAQMEMVYNSNPNHITAKAHHENNGKYVADLTDNKDRFKVKNLGSKINTVNGDFAPNYMTPEMKTLVFASNRRNMNALNKKSQWDGEHFTDVYVAGLNEFGVVGDVNPFSKEIKSKYHEGPVAFSNKGTVMYVTRSNYLNKKKGLSKDRHVNLQIYIAKKEGDKWSDLVPFKYNSDEYSTAHASVTEDGSTMYFVSDMQEPRGGNGNKSKGRKDIWRSVKKSNGEWGIPENVPSVNSEGDEMFPHINSETGILYFASLGHVGLGGLDNFRAFPNDDGTFKVINMGYGVNTSSDDFGFIVDNKEEKGYFTSNRNDMDAEFGKNIGEDDIYWVEILEPFCDGTWRIRACVKDENGVALEGATVILTNSVTGKVVAEKLATGGSAEIIDIPPGKYKVSAKKKGYMTTDLFEFDTDKVNCTELWRGNDCKVGVIMKKVDCELFGIIKEEVNEITSGQPLEGVRVTVTNNKTGKTYEYVTGADGRFVDLLEDIDCPDGLIDYSFLFEKDGYFPLKIEDFKYKIDKSGPINLNELMKRKLDLTEKKEKADITNVCGVDKIYYGFNKYKVDSKASIELDKIVACMKEYPEISIEIGSHTDCNGRRSYNERLASRRARYAMKYVVKKGISKRRITYKGYGEEEILNGCECDGRDSSCSEEEDAVNRRTTFRVTGFSK